MYYLNFFIFRYLSLKVVAIYVENGKKLKRTDDTLIQKRNMWNSSVHRDHMNTFPQDFDT